MKICRQSSGARQVRLGFGRRGCSEAPRTTPQCQKPSKHLDGFWWFLPLGHQVYVGIQPEELDPRVLRPAKGSMLWVRKLAQFILWGRMWYGAASFYRNNNNINNLSEYDGGESGIRTHGTVSRTHAFQACALSHSAISPNALS
jgi:hypothetical protein